MDANDVMRFWDETQRVRWSRDVLDGAKLPIECRDFLADVGIPKDAAIFWSMKWDQYLPPVSPKALYYKLGIESGRILALKAGDGGVYWVSEGEMKEKFLNTSAEKFCLCIIQYELFLRRAIPLDDDRVIESIERLKAGILSIDSIDLASEASYWGDVLDDIETRAEVSLQGRQ